VAPLKMGGDRRSQRIEAHADFILGQLEEKPDLTIMELRDKIRERHGLSFGYGTVWRFLARHRITRKKKTGHAAKQSRARRVVRGPPRSRSVEARVYRRNDDLDERGAPLRRGAGRRTLRAFTTKECMNYFAASGYDAVRSDSALARIRAIREGDGLTQMRPSPGFCTSKPIHYCGYGTCCESFSLCNMGAGNH